MVLLGRGLTLSSALRRLPATHTSSLLVRVPAASNSSVTSSSSEGYISRNKKLGRPISPSLRLLMASPDLVWVLSFGHRTSGVVLTTGVTVASIAYLASGTQFTEFISPLQSVASGSPVLWTSAKFLMALPLSYHCINGIRHLAWDAGRGFEMKTLYKTGYLMLTATALLTLALTLYKPSS